jgi:pyruvate/2-oxoglutarate dehydrogenase complex dihydrolipoamide acyltransferase (E2) component
MDFPSREEARVYARLQAQNAAAAEDPPAKADPPPEAATPKAPSETPSAPGSLPPETPEAATAQRFRFERRGFENDVFDRRGIRNLIRTGDVSEDDLVSVDEAAAIPAGQVPFLRSMFKLRSTSMALPPPRCRTHTEVLAFYECEETARPLCEECAPEKKFGNTTTRVCTHCGSNAQELAPAAEA